MSIDNDNLSPIGRAIYENYERPVSPMGNTEGLPDNSSAQGDYGKPMTTEKAESALAPASAYQEANMAFYKPYGRLSTETKGNDDTPSREEFENLKDGKEPYRMADKELWESVKVHGDETPETALLREQLLFTIQYADARTLLNTLQLLEKLETNCSDTRRRLGLEERTLTERLFKLKSGEKKVLAQDELKEVITRAKGLITELRNLDFVVLGSDAVTDGVLEIKKVLDSGEINPKFIEYLNKELKKLADKGLPPVFIKEQKEYYLEAVRSLDKKNSFNWLIVPYLSGLKNGTIKTYEEACRFMAIKLASLEKPISLNNLAATCQLLKIDPFDVFLIYFGTNKRSFASDTSDYYSEHLSKVLKYN